jgi:micrococcal nuclease
MCFGLEASNETKKLLEGKTVTLEKDVTETDKYSRLLRYVYQDKLFINDYLVRQGYASSYSYPPDIKYQSQFLEAQKEARDNNRGLWTACQGSSFTPSKSSQPSQSSTSSPADPNCNIKGNISSSGEKIYHMPSQQYYNKTQIDETKGERWFCTENDAVSSGWRKSKV